MAPSASARWTEQSPPPPPPAERLAGGRQDAAQGGPALPEKAEAHQDRAQGLHSKVGGRQCVAGLRQKLLERLTPLVMSDLHFSVAATSSLSTDFSSKITTQTLVFFQK